MREKSVATLSLQWPSLEDCFASSSRFTWLCVPHVRQTMRPSSWLKTVPRQTEHWLAMRASLVQRTRSLPPHVVRREKNVCLDFKN